MRTVISNDIKVYDYSQELLDFCEKELVVDNPQYYKLEAMGKYLGNTQQFLYLYEKRGDALVIPFGMVRRIWDMIKDGQVITDFTPYKPLTMTGDIQLYDYQEKALQAILRAKSGILQAPCGSGKTQIGIKLIKAIGFKALWLTHTKELLNQSMMRAKDYFEGDFGTITEGKVNIGKDITFATVQTMAMLDLQKYADEFSVVIVDECHKVAGTPTKVMQFYKVLTNLKARYKYGLSATVHRSDSLIKSTFAVLGDVVHTVTQAEVGTKIIKAKHVFINTSIDESEFYLETDGTMNHGRLIDYLVNHKDRNRLIADIIFAYGRGYSSLVLSDRVGHLQELKEMVDRHGFKTEIIFATVTKKNRQEALDRMKNGESDVLFATYGLAKEGLDIPVLSRLFLATPVKDFAVVKQSSGRIERNYKGKPQPIIYDFVDENIGYCKKMSVKRKNILKRK